MRDIGFSRATSELRMAVKECWLVLSGVAIFSALVNMLMLVGAIYMLEVYDRVLPSQSIPTLLVLSIAAFILFCAQGFFDFMRGRILIRVGNHLEERLNSRIFDLLSRAPQVNQSGPDSAQAPKHLDAIKNFLSSGGPVAFIDLPWIPFFIVILFLFHWILGAASLIGGLVIVGLTLYAEMKTREPVVQLGGEIAKKTQFTLLLRRNAEVVGSMGLRQSLVHVYGSQTEAVRLSQTLLSDLGGGMGAVSRSLRLIMQSGILGLGALLVIWGQASAGIIIAGSILFGRALAPVDQVIANWRSFTSARESWFKLEDLLRAYPAEPERLKLPKPYQSLRVESLSFADVRKQQIILRDISFSLKPGDGLCVIGPSGAGKSSLLRLLVNVWSPTGGRVMLDNAALDQWPSDDLSNHIGFVPQDVELFTGSIAQNIARFHPQIDSEKVLEAARQAGIHELVLKMKEGYQTQVGENGASLSAGQRQRVALARAIYGAPFIVALDEPNSNLDADGDMALSQAVRSIRERGGIVIAVSHRPSLLEAFDKILLLRDGRMVACGPKQEIMEKYLASAPASVKTLQQAEKPA